LAPDDPRPLVFLEPLTEQQDIKAYRPPEASPRVARVQGGTVDKQIENSSVTHASFDSI